MKEFSDEQIKKIKNLNLADISFGQEREFMENVFIGRLNFFLVVYALFLTAGVTSNLSSFRYLVFYLGAVILTLFWISLLRAYGKLDIVLRILFNHAEKHPGYIVEQISKAEGKFVRLSNVKLMAWYIPSVCITSLILGGIAFQFCFISGH